MMLGLLTSLLTSCDDGSPLCRALTPPENGSVSSSRTLASGTVTYACNAGYVLVGNGGSNIRVCLDDGQWTGSEPDCLQALTPCEPDPCLHGGACSEDGSSFACMCGSESGFTGRTCETPAPCTETLEAPTNGSVDRATGTFRDVATYFCDAGFSLRGNDGSPSRVCGADGHWSGSEPTCDPVCDPNPCRNGGTCLIDGNAFTCVCAPEAGFVGPLCADPVECTPELRRPDNGGIDRRTGTYGQVARYTCNEGYFLAGNDGEQARTCRADGSWSGSDPECVAIGGYPMWPLPGTALHPRDYDVRASTVIDLVTTLEWQRIPHDRGLDWTNARSYCAALLLDGRSDWRLPSRMELLSLADFTRTEPAIDVAVFSGTPSGFYWTSSDGARVPDTVWNVEFWRGNSGTGVPGFLHDVHCVRGAFARADSTRFSVAADGTTVDHITGLVWQRDVSTSNYSHAGALAYCGDLGDGWRVPELIELLSIVDEFRHSPAIDLTFFPDTPSESIWWSSTLRADRPEAALYVSFRDGGNAAFDRTLTLRVRCVR